MVVEKFKTEEYRGVLLKSVNKIVGDKPVEVVKFSLRGKVFEVKDLTSNGAVTKAKQLVDRMV